MGEVPSWDKAYILLWDKVIVYGRRIHGGGSHYRIIVLWDSSITYRRRPYREVPCNWTAWEKTQVVLWDKALTRNLDRSIQH